MENQKTRKPEKPENYGKLRKTTENYGKLRKTTENYGYIWFCAGKYTFIIKRHDNPHK